ncbi:MAG: hypothetical protein NTW22_04705, partial [Proteobacteria bacterium]|nr:hypothetical protein [Pseudomonadota bacterium]
PAFMFTVPSPIALVGCIIKLSETVVVLTLFPDFFPVLCDVWRLAAPLAESIMRLGVCKVMLLPGT